MRQFERRRLAIVAEQALALAQQEGEREHADLVDEAGAEQSMHELSAALRDESRAVFLFQFRDILGGVAQRHRAFPGQVAPLRVATYLVTQLKIVAMSSYDPPSAYGQ